MDKVEIKLKNGEPIYLSIAREGHAYIEDIFKSIKDAILEEEKFVEFSTIMIDIEQIVYVRLVEDDGQQTEKQQEKINPNPNPNSLFNIKLNEEIAKALAENGVEVIFKKDIDINRNIPQPKMPDFSNILKKDN
ncbi:hypothetical protein [Schinkia azotoformans]|uniref:hypothetical protein n=1 Tax=Schinkia azotoformans TaxID=1454 RepID=UPI002DBB1DE5|nr:hypothetical protein [Schinkia azotoformans]MEC1768308.1 hypothetical protein [Schinkia azotoformans]